MVLDIAAELKKTLHINSEALPWVPMTAGLEQRVLQARPEVDWYVTQLRAQPFAQTRLHRHATARGIGGFTLKGRWGHDKQYLYHPGVYIYETPGVVHQFFNGPEVSEVLFFGEGLTEFIDADTLDVSGVLTSEDQMAGYLERCQEQGIEPRFLT